MLAYFSGYRSCLLVAADRLRATKCFGAYLFVLVFSEVKITLKYSWTEAQRDYDEYNIPDVCCVQMKKVKGALRRSRHSWFLLVPIFATRETVAGVST